MIKQPWLAFLSIMLLMVVIGWSGERALFLSKAYTAEGSVTSVSGRDSRCSRRRRRGYACTKYQATVAFQSRDSRIWQLSLSSGSKRGHGQPVQFASRKVGGRVQVIYDPNNPSKAYENTIWGVWGGPLITLMFQLASLLASFTKPRRR